MFWWWFWGFQNNYYNFQTIFLIKNLLYFPDAVANAPPAIIQRNLDAPAPMFGVAVNEPQVQRNGDDSNDSTVLIYWFFFNFLILISQFFQDREEIYDAEQQRQEALRDLVAGKSLDFWNKIK